jgi:hypothetical protein
MTTSGFLYLEDVAPRFGRQWSRATRMWLLRAFHAREQRCGGVLLLRNGQGARSRWYTTEPLLRRGFPELVPWDAEMVEAARSEVAVLDERLSLAEGRLAALGRIVADIRANIGR